MHTLLKIENLTKYFDGITALNNFSCEIEEKKIIGLIGPNGAGKTTLFNVITGFILPDAGTLYFKGKDITRKSAHKIANKGIARTFQILRLIRQMRVIDNVLLSFRNQIGEDLSNVFIKAKVWKEFENKNLDRANELLDYAGIKGKANDLAGNLSYGQQKLLSIICCLASDADLLLLDEPVAGINPEMIEKILNILKDLPNQGKSIILIEHNMDAVEQICDRVIFMDEGKKISEGTPEEVRNDSRVIEAYLE